MRRPSLFLKANGVSDANFFAELFRTPTKRTDALSEAQNQKRIEELHHKGTPPALGTQPGIRAPDTCAQKCWARH